MNLRKRWKDEKRWVHAYFNEEMIHRDPNRECLFSLCVKLLKFFSRFDFNKLLMCCKGGSLKIMYESCVWLPDRSEKTFKSINIYFYNLARERGIIMGIWVLFCETSFIERVWAQGSLLSFNEFELLFLYCFVWLCGKCLPQNKQ